jgi:ribosomal protein S18 acetylase RimI-like enzyme
MRPSLSIDQLSPAEFTARIDQLVSVYAAAMRAPAEMLPGRRSVMAGHAVNPGFVALAVTDGNRPVGFGYGFHGAPGQWWHDTVRRALAGSRGAAAVADWLDDSFEVAELHVAPDYQRRGIGTDVLFRLTSGRAERTTMLSTRDADTPARRLYRDVGFTDLLTGFHFYPGSGEPAFAVMGAELPLRPRPPRPRSTRPSRW